MVATMLDQNRVQKLHGDLDTGEAEAIERGADFLFVDKRRGRRTATAAGLNSYRSPEYPGQSEAGGTDRTHQAGAR